MERELRDHLKTCAEAFARARGMEVSTVARLAANDWRFFDRLDHPEKTFTARKFDQVMGWFSTNWPTSLPWPVGVPRPTLSPDLPATPAAPEGEAATGGA